MIDVASGGSVAPEETTTHTRRTQPIKRCSFERVSYPPSEREGKKHSKKTNESVAFLVTSSPKRERQGKLRTASLWSRTEDDRRSGTREKNRKVRFHAVPFLSPQRNEEFHLRTDRPVPSLVRYAGVGSIKSMILPQVHLRKPCYDFSFL